MQDALRRQADTLRSCNPATPRGSGYCGTVSRERATLAHAADASALLEEYYREVGVVQRDTPETVRKLLTEPDWGFWIAYADGAPAGCVALRPLERFQSAAECKRLFVRAPFRRRGIAEALIDAMEDDARSRSVSWIYLDSMDDLEAAIALYRRRGYDTCERYNDNPQATVFLRKSLKAAIPIP